MDEKNRLPLLSQPKGSLHADGSRDWVHPADVSGRFQNLRKVIFVVLVAVYAVVPWIEVAGHPALFLDVQHRRFHILGETFNSQDFWLVFFLLTGIGFVLIVMTTLAGRVWCGYACPQTVFLEGFYRRVERLIEGPRAKRIRRDAAPLNFDAIWRKTLKHIVFLAFSSLLAHMLLSYFVSLPAMFAMVQKAPGEHPEAFAWATGITLLTYGNFAFFREQLCLVVCPYGRLQSAMIDKDSVVIGYDEARGEPRGKASDSSAGDCVDCKRCVVVCPTGIDIREGLQMECIGCAACVDACDDIMDKLGRERGLVRYDSLRGLAGGSRKFFRPRLLLYAVLGIVGLVVAGFAFSSRVPFEANLLRLRAAPFQVVGDRVRNSFEVHVVNKGGRPKTFKIVAGDEPGLEYTISMPNVELGGSQNRRVPVFVSYPRGESVPGKATIQVVSGDGTTKRLEAPLLGPD